MALPAALYKDHVYLLTCASFYVTFADEYIITYRITADEVEKPNSRNVKRETFLALNINLLPKIITPNKFT